MMNNPLYKVIPEGESAIPGNSKGIIILEVFYLFEDPGIMELVCEGADERFEKYSYPVNTL